MTQTKYYIVVRDFPREFKNSENQLNKWQILKVGLNIFITDSMKRAMANDWRQVNKLEMWLIRLYLNNEFFCFLMEI